MISFVILHYKNLKDTIECLKSINSLNDQNSISSVVVDNNTLSKEDKKELEKYTNHFVLLKENVGVAKAYNAGSEYAIKNLKPDYICVMNNDIEINQKDFIDLVNKSYKQNKFDMLGTKIICDGDSVNPFPVYDSLERINEAIEKNNKLIKIYSNKLKANLLETYFKIKYTFKKRPVMKNGDAKCENVGLHGCLIIFSKKYFEKEKDVMCNDTFLFHEEEFLYFRMLNKKYKSVYDPSLEIIHKEGQTMKIQNSKLIERKLFRFIECNKSLNILKNKLEKKKSYR